MNRTLSNIIALICRSSLCILGNRKFSLLLLITFTTLSNQSIAQIDISLNKNVLDVGELCTLSIVLDTNQYDYIRIVNTQDTSVLLVAEYQEFKNGKNNIDYVFSSLDSLQTSSTNFRILVKDKGTDELGYLLPNSIEIMFKGVGDTKGPLSPSLPIEIVSPMRENIGAKSLLIIFICLIIFGLARWLKKKDMRSKLVTTQNVTDWQELEHIITTCMQKNGLVYDATKSIAELRTANESLLKSDEQKKLITLYETLKHKKYTGEQLSIDLKEEIYALGI